MNRNLCEQLFYYHDSFIGRSEVPMSLFIDNLSLQSSKLFYCPFCGIDWGKVLTIQQDTQKVSRFVPFAGTCLECWHTIPQTRRLYSHPDSFWIPLGEAYNQNICKEALLVTLNGIKAAQQYKLENFEC